jgi:hypothetical protein
MKSLRYALAWLAAAAVCRAGLYGPTGLVTEASVWWGDESLVQTNVSGHGSAVATGGYSDTGYFQGIAAATAEYGRVSVMLTLSAMPSARSQQFCRARAQFTDTFAASGPIGTGTVAYNWADTDITITTLLEGQTNTAISSNSTIVVHAGQTGGVNAITFGAPFTLTYEVDAAAGFVGPGHDVLEVSYEFIRQVTGIEFYSADGENVTSNVTVVSESGALYPRGPRAMLEAGGPGRQITWHSVTAVLYSVLGSSNLMGGGWTPVATNLPGSGSTNSIPLDPPTAALRVYAVEAQ